MKKFTRLFLPFAICVGLLAFGVGAGVRTEYVALAQRSVGMLSRHVARLVTGWIVTPAGAITKLGNFPLSAAWSPDHKHLLISDVDGTFSTLQVVDAATGRVVQSIAMPRGSSVFAGLAYAPSGEYAYAAGGSDDEIHVFDVQANGQLVPSYSIPVAIRHGDASLAALGSGFMASFPIGLAISSDGLRLYTALNTANEIAVVDLARRQVVKRIRTGGYPYGVLVSRGKVFVSNWDDADVSVYDEKTWHRIALVPTGHHPACLAVSSAGIVAVANANSDTVSTIPVNGPYRATTIFVGRGTQLSSSPEGLSLSADGKRLYVALAGDNAIGVVNLNAHGGGHLVGRIPAAWYPTDVLVDNAREQLFVLSAKGFGSGPNAGGFYPNPARTSGPFLDGYQNAEPDRDIVKMMLGTLSRIPIPSGTVLATDSARVLADDRPSFTPPPRPASADRITHVIYIVRENRTYDQVFGDETFGNGDPAVTQFGRKITPDAHALAERFGLFDNFYVDAEGSSDGHNWSDGANASDYNEKLRSQANRPYDFEGGSKINNNAGGYLWDDAAAAHVSYRDYGEFYSLASDLGGANGTIIASVNAPCAGPVSTNYLTGPLPWAKPLTLRVPHGKFLCLPKQRLDQPLTQPNLVGHIDPHYRNWDLRYLDEDRVREWKREYEKFIIAGAMPQLEILRLGNDHTMGAPVGGYTPQAMVAENDVALGQLVDTVSHGPYWASTVIFVVEDDASNGADHVDAHRSPVLVISPYSSRPAKTADRTFYDTASVLKTIELLLHMKPMSHFDASANPMWSAFTDTLNFKPFDALPPNISVTAKNTRNDWAARESLRFNFSQPDQGNPNVMRQIVWDAVHGSQPGR